MRGNRRAFCMFALITLLGCGVGEDNAAKEGQRNNGQSVHSPSGNPPDGLSPGSETVGGRAGFSSAPGKQHIKFQGSRGDQVPALLYHPGTQGKLPAVMVQYGITGDKSSETIQQVADVLNQNGYLVMVIDVPGRGERTTSTGETDPVQTVLNHDLFRWYVDDYGAATSYLSTRPDVDSNRLAYVGASWGAITGIPFVARDQRIRAVVSVVGGGGFFGVIPQDLDPAQTIGQIAPRPIMLINATQDQVILEPFWKALHTAAPASAEKILFNTGHSLAGVNITQLVKKMVKFLQTSLR